MDFVKDNNSGAFHLIAFPEALFVERCVFLSLFASRPSLSSILVIRCVQVMLVEGDECSKVEDDGLREDAALEGPPEQSVIEQAVLKHYDEHKGEDDTDTESDEGAMPRGAGPKGHGSPMRTGRYEKERDLCDGAGICSVGRWPPWRRPTTRDGRVLALRSALRRAVLRTVDQADGGLTGLFGRIATGQLRVSPFSDSLRSEIADYAVSLFSDDDEGGAAPRAGDLDQPLRVRLIQALQRAVGDPDPQAMDHFARGIRLGVGVRMPRTPAVYARKTRWRLPEQASADCDRPTEGASVWRDNYRSAKLCAEAVAKQLDEHHQRGLSLRLEPAEARRRFPDLRVSSLGAVAKMGEAGSEPSIRLVLDGSHGVDINTSIRVRDQDRCPTAADVKRQQREQGLDRRGLGLAVDVSEAHRLPRVHPEDWKFQGCRAWEGGAVYIYLVGVFGIASIAYWWSRLGGAVLRILHGLTDADMRLWIMMMADDIKVESTSETPALTLLFVLLAIEVMGIPLTWRKVHGGESLRWIGYQVDVSGLRLGITESRASWSVAWCSRLVRDGQCRLDDFRSGIGRLGFVTGALEYERPFLAPLFAFAARHSNTSLARLPLYVVSVLRHLAGRFEHRRMYPSTVRRSKAREPFRVDACADENGIGVGGWLPTRNEAGQLSTKDSPWFAVKLDQNNAPWAYSRGEPYRSIAALEAFGVLLALLAFASEDKQNCDTTVVIGGLTDNKGNSYVLNRLMTTKFPLCAVVMELAAQMEKTNSRISLDWAPRELNKEADDLSNEIFDAFSTTNRVNLSICDYPWIVLNDLMLHGASFVKEKALRPPLTESIPGRAKKRPLRETDPW